MDEQQKPQQIFPLLDLQSIKAVSVLGRGAKGVAFLIKNQEENFALKVISKSSIEKKKNKNEQQVDLYKRIWFERDVLNLFDHPLLPKLRGVLSTDDIIGFAIDYCSGGDLNILRKQQTEKMFSYDVIRFYAAELVLVLEYLHELGIMYRDLKPENILIQESGHLMIVDFDLSAKLSSDPSVRSNHSRSSSENIVNKRKKKKKFPSFSLCSSGISQVDSVETKSDSGTESVEKSNSFVGTEEYVAPEIIIGKGHDFSVDWWSLGVVMYEMLYGRTPFRGINRKETFYRILTKSPELVGEQNDLRDLIGKLLEKDPATRISVEAIKGHDFFVGVNWDSILRISRPPYIPCGKWDDYHDLEEINALDVNLVVKGIFDGDKNSANIDKTNLNLEENNKSIWVEGLTNPANNADFLIF